MFRSEGNRVKRGRPKAPAPEALGFGLSLPPALCRGPGASPVEETRHKSLGDLCLVWSLRATTGSDSVSLGGRAGLQAEWGGKPDDAPFHRSGRLRARTAEWERIPAPVQPASGGG